MAHLVSTGNVVTMCTNANESYLINGTCNTTYDGFGNQHSANLNTVTNSIESTYEGNLINDSWTINFDDFYKITGQQEHPVLIIK